MLDMKKALTKIMKAPIVVETGTSGNWTYRKWSDGTAECWGLHTSSITQAGQTGQMYYSNPVTLNLPFSLHSYSTSVASVTFHDYATMAVNVKFQSATTISYSVVRPTTTSGITLYARIYVIGKWK